MIELQLAMEAFRNGHVEMAERHCRTCLGLQAHHPTASLILGEILLGRGAASDAESLIANALIANPGHSDLLTLRGIAFARLNRTEDALTSFNQAVERRITNSAAQRLLGTLLAERRDPTPRFSVTVVTATIGLQLLKQAMESVQAQSYPLVEHFVVIDGCDHEAAVNALLPQNRRHPLTVLVLPKNTGSDGYLGHRIYGAAPFLVNGRFIAYLDEDNWFEPDHLTHLMSKVTSDGLDWAYALRNIVDSAGVFVTTDDCQSLGHWPTFNRPDQNLVDVNCYVLRRDIALAKSSIWYRRYARDEENPDFVLCRQLLQEYPNCGTSGRYTVNYRAGRAAPPEFFVHGQSVMQQRFPAPFPWRADSHCASDLPPEDTRHRELKPY